VNLTTKQREAIACGMSALKARIEQGALPQRYAEALVVLHGMLSERPEQEFGGHREDCGGNNECQCGLKGDGS
jgi:hypothetical protein